MANALYDLGRQGFLEGAIDWDTDTIRDALIRESGGGAGPYYTPNLATDNDMADVPDNADCRVDGVGPSTGVTLGTKTVTAGVADAADSTHATVAAGDAIQSIVIYSDTTTDATSRLIANIDTATGLPVTPNGGDITVTWDDGANKIFKL